jgi:alkaline phosphatase D
MPHETMNRRTFLQSMGLGAAGAGVSACAPATLPAADPRPVFPPAWEGVGPEDLAVFPQGVQCGDPHPASVLLWTRTTSASAEVIVARGFDGTWAEPESLACVVSEGGFIHVEVGFDADQPFAYQFRDTEGRCSRIGYGRSAPAPDAAVSVVLGATSCASQGHGDFPSMPATMSRGPVDLWCWLGDVLYNDGVTTTSGYRANWQRQLSRDGFQAVLGNTASTFTWDDHEVDNDWGDTAFGDPVDPVRLGVAYEAFFAHTPTRRDPEDDRRIYRSLRLGRTAEVFVLDCRGERDEEGGVYISEAQMTWLLDGLAASTATWKVLLNSVPITNLPDIYDIEQVIRDRWEGYPDQRERLLNFIADEDISGVLFVSGDVHHATFSRVDPEGGPGHRTFEVFTGPAGSTRNILGNLIGDEQQYLWSAAVWNCTRFELHPLGYATIEVVGEEGEIWLQALIDDRGNVLYYDGEQPE